MIPPAIEDTGAEVTFRHAWNCRACTECGDIITGHSSTMCRSCAQDTAPIRRQIKGDARFVKALREYRS